MKSALSNVVSLCLPKIPTEPTVFSPALGEKVIYIFLAFVPVPLAEHVGLGSMYARSERVGGCSMLGFPEERGGEGEETPGSCLFFVHSERGRTVSHEILLIPEKRKTNLAPFSGVAHIPTYLPSSFLKLFQCYGRVKLGKIVSNFVVPLDFAHFSWAQMRRECRGLCSSKTAAAAARLWLCVLRT